VSTSADMAERATRAAERRERWLLASLALPAIIGVVLFLVVPTGWLFYQSFIDQAGHLTAIHYLRLWENPATVGVFRTTFSISVTVTAVCILLGYPVAYLLAQTSRRTASLLMIFVVLPYWTSVLVRTYAWIVLLQRNGIVNKSLQATGIIDEPLRLANTYTGVVIGMAHIMLPFFILPVYATMTQIDTRLMRAAATMGASPSRRFWTVFFPLSMPGLVAGTFLVFVLCLGFYVTPTLLGGGRVQMIAQSIETSISLYSSWGAASASGVILLLTTATLLGLSALAMKLGRRGR